MREIDVIDVSRQEDYKMLMREWTEYFNSPNRNKVFNVISLEFSNTKLSDLVLPPTIVRQLSWISNIWPDQLPDDCTYTRPEVQKYCLMGVKDSFTDFHIDFGGTSVWYHVLWGEKVFYLIRPTTANVALYETWVSSSNQSETFFGDQVDICYKCVVKQGQTFFIPTGWIHAVFTPIDSLVFGGNFLHDFNVPLQLQVYEIEKRVKTPAKYLFPSFETTNWYAAKHILDVLKDYIEDGKKPPPYTVSAAKALATHLKSWTQRKDLNNLHLFIKDAKHDIPEHIQYGKLLKDLSKRVKDVDTQGKVSIGKPKQEKTKEDKPKKKKKTTKPAPKQMKNIDILHQHTQEKLLQMEKEQKKNIYNFQDEEDDLPASLKVRIPKAGAYIEAALRQERDISLKHKEAVKLESDIKQEIENIPEKKETGGLRLKVSNGKIVSDIGKKGNKGSGKFQPLVSGEDDSDNDNLVVDENPKRQKQVLAPSSLSTLKPGSLKLKLSFHGKTVPQESSSQESTQESDVNTSQSSQGSQGSQSESEEPSGEEAALRANLPTIRGGLNGSIADILEASGYGTETEFKVDNEIGRSPSPSMRDAIQGMLSMSQMGGAGGMELFTSRGGRRSGARLPRSQLALNDEEKMETCYKDDEFIYPTLDLSDDESDSVFKARNKEKRDDTWNPKARVQITIPMGERPHREGVKKESVEQGLAAAAAKAALPKPKKRKRTKSEEHKEVDAVPGPSAGLSLSSSAPGSAFRPNLAKPVNVPESPTKAKKPKKGFATAKQRLGKILKMHKMKIM